jgi:hypothetical protein
VVARAGVNPLPASCGPDLLPAIIPVVQYVAIVVRDELIKGRSANEYNIAEMAVMSEASPIVESASGNLPAYSDAAGAAESVSPEMHSASATVSVERHGRRRRDKCRRYRGRGNPTEKFGHRFDPPPKTRKPDARGIAK